MNQYEESRNELNELIDCIGQWILEDEQQPSTLQPLRLQMMNFSYSILKRIAAENGMTVSYELHKPFQSMGRSCLEGEDLVFLHCKQLARAISLADNVDVFPLTNGRVRFVLTFHGLTKRINSAETPRTNTSSEV